MQKAKPAVAGVSKVQCCAACSVCVSHSNAQHQSRGESCWQRPPFMNISSSHHFLSPLFLPWETRSFSALLPNSQKEYVSQQCLMKFPWSTAELPITFCWWKSYETSLLPIFTGKSTERSQSMPSLCTMSSAAATNSPISSLLTAGTLMQHTTLSQTLQFFLMNWTPNTRLVKASHIQHLGRLPPDGRHNFLFFIHYVVEHILEYILHNQNWSFHLILQADVSVRFLAITDLSLLGFAVRTSPAGNMGLSKPMFYLSGTFSQCTGIPVDLKTYIFLVDIAASETFKKKFLKLINNNLP